MTIYAVNALWIMSTTLGLLLALYGAREAWLDWRAVKKYNHDPDSAKSVLARAAVMQQSVLAIGQLAFWVPGIQSLFGPYPTNPVSVVAALILLGSWAMTGASAISYWANSRVARQTSAELEEDLTRHATRDAGRDEGRDPIRDAARDIARDKEVEDA